LGSAGAGVALCGAYVAMLTVLYVLTRSLFRVAFDWRRLTLLVAILAGVAVSGELLLPTSGAGGFVLRALWLLLAPVLLFATRFFAPHELSAAREMVRAARGYRRRGAPPEPGPGRGWA